jgi:hypothetical protein
LIERRKARRVRGVDHEAVPSSDHETDSAVASLPDSHGTYLQSLLLAAGSQSRMSERSRSSWG